jgi:peptide/nickel transport system permease protein
VAQFIARRFLLLIPTALGVTIVVFIVMRMLPGDVARLLAGLEASESQVAELRVRLGLEQPLPIQYWTFLTNLARGDLGVSLYSNAPVLVEISARAPYTLRIVLASMLISTVVGLSLGIITSVRPYSLLDNLGSVSSVAGLSIPSFWLGLMLMYVFSERLHWLPTVGYGTVKHLILPSIALGLPASAIVGRLTRGLMIETLRQDYIRTAWAKGLTERKVVLVHAVRNVLIPVVTVVGLQVGFLIGGTVVVEVVFAYPGLGKLMVDSISNRDFPMVQGGVLVIGLSFALINLLVDISYGLIDPRIGYG